MSERFVKLQSINIRSLASCLISTVTQIRKFFRPCMSTETQPDTVVSQDIFRILITNDNHIGFKQDDVIRRKDALVTFEEIIQIARLKNVDFILHSGDLFDECRPNRFWMTSVMRLLQENCFGSKEVLFSQLRTEFSSSKKVNFEDPNRNIDLPIYMIHGNHDDPGGEYGDAYALSAADMLEANYLVNYFGRQDNVEEEIEVKPLLFQKGSSKLALYGLGNMHEERLHRMFQAKKVKFLTPPETKSYFHLMSIHQNRYRGAAGGAPSKNCVHDSFLPSFLNLVVWAHEHECIASPQQSVECGFHILQSGSSVQTSLTHGEQVPKHVFLLEVCGDKFRTTAIPLLSVRTLMIDDLLIPGNVAVNSQQGEALLSAKIETLIARGVEEGRVRRESYKKWLCENGLKPPMFESINPEIPLVRLRLQLPSSVISAAERQERIGNVHILNQKFGRYFTGRVANVSDLLQFVSSRTGSSMFKKRTSSSGVVQLELEDAVDEAGLMSSSSSQQQPAEVQDLIFNYMGGQQGEALLDALAEPDFNVAVQDYVHKSDAGAIERFLKRELEAINKLTVGDPAVRDVSGLVETVKKRAQEIRNERLNAALAMVDEPAPPLDEELNDNRAEEIVSDVDDFSDGGVGKRARSARGSSAATIPKRGRNEYGNNRGKKIEEENIPSSVFLAATNTTQIPPTLTGTAKRQWARRM